MTTLFRCQCYHVKVKSSDGTQVKVVHAGSCMMIITHQNSTMLNSLRCWFDVLMNILRMRTMLFWIRMITRMISLRLHSSLSSRFFCFYYFYWCVRSGWYQLGTGWHNSSLLYIRLSSAFRSTTNGLMVLVLVLVHTMIHHQFFLQDDDAGTGTTSYDYLY